jgi:hypothetical protein
MPSAVTVASTPARGGSGPHKARIRGSSCGPGDQPVLAAQLLAVIAEHQAALVDQAEAGHSRRGWPRAGRVIVLAAVDARRRSTPLPRCRRAGSRSSWCRRAPACCARRWCAAPGPARRTRSVGSGPAPPQLTTSRCAPSTARTPGSRRSPARSCAAAAAARRRARRSCRAPTAADSPSRAPGAAAGRAGRSLRPARSGARLARIAALPARQRAVAHGDAMKRGERGRRGARAVGQVCLAAK